MQRDIFFVHGFEARSPRHHRRAQVREARAWSEAHGVPLRIGPFEEIAPGHGAWDLTTPQGRVRFHLLDWSDLVRSAQARRWWHVAWDGLMALQRGLMQGYFGRIRRQDWGVWLVLLLGFAPLGASLVALSVALVFPAWWSMGVAVAVIALTLAALAAGPRSPVRYVLDIAWGARRLALRDHPRLEARRAVFAEALEGARGEVLIVGHSMGAALALELAARSGAPLLTLGQSIPLISEQRDAAWARQALRGINSDWIDISAGRDLLGFDGFDPSGGKARCYPARFARALPAARLGALRWDGYATHLLYVAASSRSGVPWDWFWVLVGAQALPERLAGEVQKPGTGARRFPL